MTSDNEKNPLNSFVAARLPWLLGIGMLLVFLFTLNHGPTPVGIAELVDFSGWAQRSHPIGPITFIVSYPLRWLPIASLPLALNLFSAVCGAIALMLLARSVALLPHDRTLDQRERENSPYSLLSIRTAWLPPVFAVLVCGLQTTFWENAIQATEGTFNLLLFAYVIRCLLEYRINENLKWIYRFAFIYGLGMANDFAFIGFFPAFLVAVVWIRGLAFFNTQFLVRLFGLGLLGAAFYLFLPFAYKFTHAPFGGFWDSLKSNFIMEKNILARFPREIVLLLSLTSLLPVFVIGIRWASQFGDRSELGVALATAMFHIIHALFLVAALWSFLGAPIGPRNMGLGIPFLTFYYLAALAVGYFAGYFLLVFRPILRKNGSISSALKVANGFSVALIVFLFVAVPTIQVLRNLPFLTEGKAINEGYQTFAELQAKSLPDKNLTVVLSDDMSRLAFLHIALANAHRQANYLLVDSGELINNPKYLKFLAKGNPAFHLPSFETSADGRVIDTARVIQFLDVLAKQFPIYYLQASFGSFFERFYLEPQGVVYQLKHYSSDSWNAPLVSATDIVRNNAAWQSITNQTGSLVEIVNGRAPSMRTNALTSLFASLRLKPDRNWTALPLGAYYSSALNFWGVELQKADHLKEAAHYFEAGRLLNPLNVLAYYNFKFNEALQQKKPLMLQTIGNMEQALSPHNNWSEALSIDGRVDDPNFREDLAIVFAKGGNYRQAVQQLNRIKVLIPDDLKAPLQLAQLFVIIHSYTNALTASLPLYRCLPDAVENTDIVLNTSPRDPNALFLKAVALIQQEKYADALPSLNILLTDQPNNSGARLNRAIAGLKSKNYAVAKGDYESLRALDPRLPQVYYGLGEIAYYEKDSPQAIKNYELYLTVAPTNTDEAKVIISRLQELKGGKN